MHYGTGTVLDGKEVSYREPSVIDVHERSSVKMLPKKQNPV